jgi:hypothetical protein
VNKKRGDMGCRKQRLSISEAKEKDIVDYLSQLGYQPAKIRNVDYWNNSPLLNEKDASFKINRKPNRWYDHGIGKGGNIIDFGIQFHSCSVGEFLQKLNGGFSFHQLVFYQAGTPEKQSKITVLQDTDLNSFALLRYLETRSIPAEMARQFCREVRYELDDKIYYRIGFKNDSGGFEIHNSYFKACSSPNDITTIKNRAEEAIAFEDFIEFFSFKTHYKNQPIGKRDFVILYSLSFFKKGRWFMDPHRAIRLYLDNDAAGKKCVRHALPLSRKCLDDSCAYKHHKDLKDWAMNFGRLLKKSMGQKMRWPRKDNQGIEMVNFLRLSKRTKDLRKGLKLIKGWEIASFVQSARCPFVKQPVF